MKKEDFQAALEAISKGGIHVAGDLVLEKHVENEVANVEAGGIGIQIVKGSSTKPKVAKGKNKQADNHQKPRETMTFKKNNGVLDGHITLLFDKMTKEGWINGNEADFKALFSGKRDDDCVLTWLEPFGKAALYTLFSALKKEGHIIVPKGYAISSILEGHFKDKSGQWLFGLDKGNKTNNKALPFITECVRLLKISAKGYYEDEEDSSTTYDPYDHQDLKLHKR